LKAVTAAREIIALGLLCSTLAADSLVRAAGDWSTSAEAYFLTSEERREWKTLSTEDAREAFERDYWARRDPTPGTPRNEFKELVLARIQRADAEFALGKKRGSETAEGTVYVVLGAPSVRQQTMGPLKTAPEMSVPGQLGLPKEAFERREWHTWVYDRSTRADLLDVLGAASIEITFVVEPGKRDELQNPGRFQPWRELVARHSIQHVP
jgi:GWxTD domain-containing protein